MPTSTSDTPNIDEKKNIDSESNTNETTGNIISFVKTVFTLLVIIIIYFSIGSFILFGCKLSQSNILPTEIDCYPYTNTKPKIEKIISNIFETWTDPPQSMKIEFDVDNKTNSKFILLDAMRKLKIDPKASSIINYFIEILQSMTCFNYSCINTILNILNNAPEMVTIFLGPFMIGFFITIICFINFFYFIYLWFSKMSWFFKKNNNKNGDRADWKDITFLDPINYGFSIFTIIVFIILFFILFFTGVITFIPSFIIFWSLFSSLGYKAIMDNKIISVFTITKDVLKYYKVTIMTIFSIFVTILAFTNLGTSQGIFSLLVLLLISFGVISIDIFKKINPENLSALTSYEQASKECIYKKEENKGFINRIFGQSGGSFVKELKKISKKLKKTNE